SASSTSSGSRSFAMRPAGEDSRAPPGEDLDGWLPTSGPARTVVAVRVPRVGTGDRHHAVLPTPASLRARPSRGPRAVGAALALAVLAVPAQAQERPPIFRTEHGGPRLAVAARARTGVQPKSVRVSPDGTRVVVCNF